MPKPNPESRLKTVTWRDLVDPYMTPDNKRSIWQIVNTIIPLVASYVPDVFEPELFLLADAGVGFPSRRVHAADLYHHA